MSVPRRTASSRLFYGVCVYFQSKNKKNITIFMRRISSFRTMKEIFILHYSVVIICCFVHKSFATFAISGIFISLPTKKKKNIWPTLKYHRKSELIRRMHKYAYTDNRIEHFTNYGRFQANNPLSHSELAMVNG